MPFGERVELLVISCRFNSPLKQLGYEKTRREGRQQKCSLMSQSKWTRQDFIMADNKVPSPDCLKRFECSHHTIKESANNITSSRYAEWGRRRMMPKTWMSARRSWLIDRIPVVRSIKYYFASLSKLSWWKWPVSSVLWGATDTCVSVPQWDG